MKRVGHGWDIHALVENRALIIGGVEIPNTKGSLGHSDGDALVHAIIDSLLGAAGLKDIGTQFPDNDETYKDISSLVLLRTANDLIRENGYYIENIDSTIILQEPKLFPYIDQIRENIAQSLDMEVENIGVKAKTAEGMLGELGKGEAISAMAVALLSD